MTNVQDPLTQTLPRCQKAFVFGSSPAALPDEMLERAAQRLAIVGLVYSGCFAVFYIAYQLVQGSPIIEGDTHFFVTLSAVLLGVGMYAISRWSGLGPCRVLPLGLIFQVASSFLIAFEETWFPFTPQEVLRGHSAVAIWIVYFALLVPVTWTQTILASVASAMTLPLALSINIMLEHTNSPTAAQWVMLNLAPAVMVAATAPLSRYIYTLGTQVTKAREAGTYEFIERIGQGGMGEIWRAKHRMLAREAAVKLIRPRAMGLHDTPVIEAARRRFEREARATAALQSPHTVTLYDYGVTDEGALYYAMELVRGLDLEDLVRKHGAQPPERVVKILAQVCDSLAEAHAHGLTHRDVKPRNILIGRLGLEFDFVKVVDFGLVKALRASEQTQLTQDGTTTGTPGYMAPEVALGDNDVDHRADIYAVGCVGYWLLTGQHVFEGKTAMAVALEHIQSQPVPPSQRAELPVSPELDSVILECLAKKPVERPRTALDLKERLLRAVPGREWTPDEAEEWWDTHAPEVAAGSHARAVLV
ncbi:MAG: protein kinase [Bryobacterales bacterium]|nr:protein kinase [Bryobacterales bacterium]